jgi:uroporphyrin-III C-methyltransferase
MSYQNNNIIESQMLPPRISLPLGEKQGKAFISFASAGCGDPDLLTIKAAKVLQQAEVILTDRLVSKEILDRYVKYSATIVYVGKQAYKEGSTKQATINELLVQYAQLGKKIVRLKGGDSSIFGNILDELETVTKHNIPFEIIPGVTAALGAAAYGGIPLTARNYANAVRFLTYWKKDAISENYWQELAQTDDTLVFYMSSEVLPEVVFHLTKNNISAEKKLAIIEQATTPQQQITISDLYDFKKNGLENKTFASPTLIIIGKVVNLHERFKWFLERGGEKEREKESKKGKEQESKREGERKREGESKIEGESKKEGEKESVLKERKECYFKEIS